MLTQDQMEAPQFQPGFGEEIPEAETPDAAEFDRPLAASQRKLPANPAAAIGLMLLPFQVAAFMPLAMFATMNECSTLKHLAWCRARERAGLRPSHT